MSKLEQQDHKLSQILDAVKNPAPNLGEGLDAVCLFYATQRQSDSQSVRQTERQRDRWTDGRTDGGMDCDRQ